MSNLFKVLFLIVPLKAVVLPSGNCPQPNVILPCTCVDSTYHNLRCEGLTNVEDLQSVFRASSGSGIKSFKITLSVLPNFPLDILNDVPLDRLYIRENNFHDLFSSSDYMQNNVQHLVIKNVEVTNGWHWDNLRSFRFLNTLVIHATKVGATISSEFTREMSKNIENLSLINCGIEVIESGAFRRQKKLRYLSLPRNKLRTIVRSSLPIPSTLTQLNLENNEISYLPDDIFSAMPNLTYVTLSNNALAVVSETIFHSVWESESALELQGNPIKCDCQMQWISGTNATGLSVFGTCAHPKHLYGKELRELTYADFQCER